MRKRSIVLLVAGILLGAALIVLVPAYVLFETDFGARILARSIVKSFSDEDLSQLTLSQKESLFWAHAKLKNIPEMLQIAVLFEGNEKELDLESRLLITSNIARIFTSLEEYEGLKVMYEAFYKEDHPELYYTFVSTIYHDQGNFELRDEYFAKAKEIRAQKAPIAA